MRQKLCITNVVSSSHGYMWCECVCFSTVPSAMKLFSCSTNEAVTFNSCVHPVTYFMLLILMSGLLQLMQVPWPQPRYGSDVTALVPNRNRISIMFSCRSVWERTENGRVSTVGFARVPRVSWAARRLSEGPSLSAHLLPPLPPRHPRLTWRAALPRVPDVGGVRCRWTPQQYPPCAPVGWYQATASKDWSWSGSLHEWYFWSRGQNTQWWNQGARPPRSAAPESPG